MEVKSAEYKAVTFYGRPGFGSEGKKITVKTNYFPLTSLPEADVHHYESHRRNARPLSLEKFLKPLLKATGKNLMPSYLFSTGGAMRSRPEGCHSRPRPSWSFCRKMEMPLHPTRSAHRESSG